MSLLHEPTAAESRRLIREKSIRIVAEATNHLVSVGIEENRKFWAVDPEQLVADLNADLEASLALMAANTALFAGPNASLDLLNIPEYTKRVPLEIGNPTITFDAQTPSTIINGIEKGNPKGTNLFVYTPPAVIEPEILPEP